MTRLSVPPAHTPETRSEHDGLNFLSVAEDGKVVIFVRGEIDMATAPMLWERLAREIPDVTTRLVLDLYEVPFVDSMGLGVFARAVKRLHHGAELVLRHPSPKATKVLNISGLAQILTIQA